MKQTQKDKAIEGKLNELLNIKITWGDAKKLFWAYLKEAERQGYEKGYKHEKENCMNAYKLGKQEGAEQKARLIYNDVFENFRNTDGTYMILEFIEQKHLKEVKK